MKKISLTSLTQYSFFVAYFVCSMMFGTSAFANNTQTTIPVFNAEDINSLCTQKLEDLKQRVSQLEEIKAYTPEGSVQFIQEWNRLVMAMDDIHGPVYLLSQVSPDEAVRKNAEVCDTQLRTFNTDLYLNDKLYKNVRQSRTTDNVERKLRKDILSDFEDAGVALLPKRQERIREIRIRLNAIQQEFSRNIRDNKTRVVFTPEQMSGLPDEYLSRLKKDSSGNYLLDFSYPVYVPFMQYANDSNARRQYQFEFLNRGTSENLELLQEAISLRQEMAKLAGYRSYADYKLRRRMAQKPGTVQNFLDQVHQAIAVAEQAELEDLKQYKSEKLGIPLANTNIERWDVTYWQEKIRKERFNIDQNELRRYFPTDAAIRWTLGLSEALYGISFKERDVAVWHEDVMSFDVFDKTTGQLLGGIYLDLFPREGKYGHAAAFPVKAGSTIENRKPISVLVTNFNRVGLDHNELETLLHEFGHVLHGVLSQTRYAEQSGTSVERDFVEAPSQMFEEWAHKKESLELLPRYCSSECPTVDAELLNRLNQARKFGKGTFYARQLLYAKYDMALYDENEKDVMALWQEMEGKTALGHVQGTQFPGQFNHTISGYAAGYYGYLWSEVLAADMLSEFGNNLMNPKMGQHYRKTILERGSEAPARELIRTFLGREPSSKAFYQEITGKN